jgi:hypothetical protein
VFFQAPGTYNERNYYQKCCTSHNGMPFCSRFRLFWNMQRTRWQISTLSADGCDANVGYAICHDDIASPVVPRAGLNSQANLGWSWAVLKTDWGTQAPAAGLGKTQQEVLAPAGESSPSRQASLLMCIFQSLTRIPPDCFILRFCLLDIVTDDLKLNCVALTPLFFAVGRLALRIQRLRVSCGSAPQWNLCPGKKT